MDDFRFIADFLDFVLGIDPIGWERTAPYLLVAFLGGYLLGSIPFGLVLTRAAGLGDIRKIGSGNIGATNVLRTGRKGLALATLLLDGGKGAIAVLIAGALVNQDFAVLAGLGALLGHLFPVWLGFRGGKGVATVLGTLLAISWPVGISSCLTWLAVAALFRISSLAALVSIAGSVGWAWLFSSFTIAGDYWSDPQRTQFCALVAVLVIYRHHANIRRLLSGTEPKIGRKNQPTATAAPGPGTSN